MRILDRFRDQDATGKTHDPVCDMWVDPATAPARSEHEGRVIHFCAAGCKRAFDKDPQRFLARMKGA